VSVTDEVNPLTGATVTVEEPVAPTTCVRVVGLAVTEKSGTAVVLTVRVTVVVLVKRLKVPLNPMW